MQGQGHDLGLPYQSDHQRRNDGKHGVEKDERRQGHRDLSFKDRTRERSFGAFQGHGQGLSRGVRQTSDPE